MPRSIETARRRGRAAGLVTRAFGGMAVRETRAAARRSRRPARRHAVPEAPGDPLSAEVLADPPAWFRALHARGPVHYCSRRHLWILNGHEEVRAGAAAHDVLSSAEGSLRLRIATPMLTSVDRPEHARLRRVLARDFTASVMSAMRPVVATFTAQALDRLTARPGSDLQRELAGPLPLAVLADLLRVPAAQRGAFRRWSDGIVAGPGLALEPAAVTGVARAIRGFTGLASYFEEAVEERRRAPGDDVLSKLVSNEMDGGLTNDELYWFVALLIVAGNETTTSLLGHLAVELARDPGRLELLRERPELVASAVEEGLRHGSPAQAFFRTATSPYEVAGAVVAPGERVMLGFAAANRDPARFDDPDDFRIERDPRDHLAFGHGIHFCLGAHLARLEAQVFLEQLRERVARIDLTAAPSWRGDPTFRGPAHVPVRLVPAG